MSADVRRWISSSPWSSMHLQSSWHRHAPLHQSIAFMTSAPCVSTHLSQHAWALTVVPTLSSSSEAHQPAPGSQAVGGGSQSPPSLS